MGLNERPRGGRDALSLLDAVRGRGPALDEQTKNRHEGAALQASSLAPSVRSRRCLPPALVRRHPDRLRVGRGHPLFRS